MNKELISKVNDYITETQGGRKFLLDKEYKPALEELVTSLGYVEDYYGNRLLVKIPELPQENSTSD